MRALLLALSVSLVLAWPAAPRAGRVGAGPLRFFGQEVTLDSKDVKTLQSGALIVRILPGHGKEVAVFTAMRLNADGARLVSWLHHVSQLRKSEYVLASGAFSSPPRLEDLAGLSLDDNDLDDIAHCEPGSCGLKLTNAEMQRLRATIAGKPRDWKARLQDAFRRLVLARVNDYLARGHAGDLPYEDKGHPVDRAAVFDGILHRSLSIGTSMPEFAAYLEQYPRATDPAVESLFYWSKDRLDGKAEISVTQIAIVQSNDPSLPEALAAGKQVFATHYVNGSLSLTAVIRDPEDGRHYLAYLNRSDLDMIGGLFGGLVRRIIEHRVKNDVPAVLRGLRTRIESGEPTGR